MDQSHQQHIIKRKVCLPLAGIINNNNNNKIIESKKEKKKNSDAKKRWSDKKKSGARAPRKQKKFQFTGGSGKAPLVTISQCANLNVS